MSFNTMTDAELQELASEPGAVGVQARSALRDRQVALCAVCSTPLEGGSDSGVPFPPLAEGKRAHVRCVSMPQLRQVTEEMAREDSERGRYARKRLGEIEQYERCRTAATAASVACDAAMARAGSGRTEPQVGDYVRWDNTNVGSWLEGRLLSRSASEVGHWTALVQVDRGSNPAWPRMSHVEVGVDAGAPMRRMELAMEAGPRVAVTPPQSRQPVVHIQNHFNSDEIIKQFEAGGMDALRAMGKPQRQCNHTVYPREAATTLTADAAYSALASYDPSELRREFGFDRLSSEYRPHTRCMQLTAVRVDKYAAIEIPAREMCARKPAELLRDYCQLLACELGRVPEATTKPTVTFGDVRTSPGIVVSVKAPDATPQVRQPVIRITNHFTSDDALRTMRESQAETAKAIVRLRAERAAVDELRRSPPDPLDVIIDGNTLRELLVIDEVQRRGEVTPHVSFTPAQRAAVSAHWSADLRRQVADSIEAELQRVVLDAEDE